MGQTNALNGMTREFADFEIQVFRHDLPLKIESIYLGYDPTSLAVWVNGFQSSDSNEPDALAELSLQVWLLRNDGTALSSIGKTILDRGWQQTFSFSGKHEYMDSILYCFTKVPVKDLAGVVIRANGKLYYYQVDQNKWQR